MKVVATIRGVLLRAENNQFRWQCQPCRLWGPVAQPEAEARGEALAHAQTVHGGWVPAGGPVSIARGRYQLGRQG